MRDPHYILKEIVRTNKGNKIKYSHFQVKILLIKYKNKRKVEVRNEIIKYCYPIILKVLEQYGRRFNTQEKIFDNLDLFNESVLKTIECIEKYDVNNRTRFITYLWRGLYRGLVRFTTSNITKHSKYSLKYDNYDPEKDEFYEREDLMLSYFSFYMEDVELDELNEKLGPIEKELLDRKLRNENIETILKDMKISLYRYYSIMDSLKDIYREEVLDGDC